MRRVLVRPASYAVALAALWGALAFLNDATTYHLAPGLIAIVVPLGVAMEPRSRSADLLPGAVVGAVIALAATGVLYALSRLSGPSLLPFGDAVVEAAIFAFAGTVVGLLLAGLFGGRR